MERFADIIERIRGILFKTWDSIEYGLRSMFEAVQQAHHKLMRTLFTKYLFVTSGIIILSFILFGTVLSSIVANKWQDEKQQLLADNINSIADRAGRYIVPKKDSEEAENVNYQFSSAASSNLRGAMAVIGQSLDADLFLTDNWNNVLLCAEDDPQNASADEETVCIHRGRLPEGFVMDAISKAEKAHTNVYRTTDTLGDIYPERQFIVAVPIITQDINGDDTIVGLAVAVTSAKWITEFKSEITNVALIAILIASLISLTLVYFLTYQQVKPLRDMAAAVSRFAGGDFGVRVPVTDETEVGQLACAFNSMASSLASSETMRRSFIANVSHELKTPMTTISGFVDGMLDGTIPPERHVHYLTVVSSETKRLARLVRSMLDLSRIDSGDMKLNKVRFNLSDTVMTTLLSFEQRIEEKHIEIQGMDHIRPMYVYGDRDLLHQVVYNLMDNAVKFTNEGGYINIKVYSKERNAFVRISNSGIGIPSDELPHVFERFYKTDKSRSFDKSGVGLGLFIVKTVIALHNGGIEARSAEGKYCEFEFHVPISGKD